MDCFIFQQQTSLQNQMYPSANLAITESSSDTNSYSLNSFFSYSHSVSSPAASDSLSIATAESRTGLLFPTTVNEVAEQNYSGDNTSVRGNDTSVRTPRRPRLVWTPQLHKRFVDAVAHLGIKNAVPKTIMQLMSIDGLTREEIAAHLQKYRLYLKKMQGLYSAGHSFPSVPGTQSLLENGGDGSSIGGGGASWPSHPMPINYREMGMQMDNNHEQIDANLPYRWL